MVCLLGALIRDRYGMVTWCTLLEHMANTVCLPGAHIRENVICLPCALIRANMVILLGALIRACMANIVYPVHLLQQIWSELPVML